MKNYAVNLVLGLGNYGPKFDGTRHNIGFEVLDRLNSANKKWNAGEHGLWCLDNFNKSVLIKPITGMNNCGTAISDGCESMADKHKCNIIVIHDDTAFDPGEIRIKSGGGAGRHNGLKSVIRHIGKDFVRVRVGIGQPEKGQGLDYVLGKFHHSEKKIMAEAAFNAALAVVWIINNGVAKAMNKFNRRNKDE